MIWGFFFRSFSNPGQLGQANWTAAIGHVCYATAGEASLRWITSSFFLFFALRQSVWLCSQWNLTNNAESLRRESENGAPYRLLTPEISSNLIIVAITPSFMGKVKGALNTVKGGFAYLSCLRTSSLQPWIQMVSAPFIGKMANGLWFHLKPVPWSGWQSGSWFNQEAVIIDDNGITSRWLCTDTWLFKFNGVYLFGSSWFKYLRSSSIVS